MGKRKLNATTFHQCEWTGYPMRAAHCYWPSWSHSGKLVKKGSYCNWEAVVAHAHWLRARDNITEAEHESVVHHVNTLTGTFVESAPHYEELSHIKGEMSAEKFHEACTRHTHPVTAVKIHMDGQVSEVTLHPNAGTFSFDDYFQHSGPHGALSSFHSMHKRGKTDRDLTVFYYPAPHQAATNNATASNLFKMRLDGDVLLVQQSREQSFMSRSRYVDFTLAMYEEHFTKKRKRVDPPGITTAQYEDVKQQMQATLNEYEREVAGSAVPPKEVSKVSAAVVDGKALAKKVKDRTKHAAHAPPPQVLVEA